MKNSFTVETVRADENSGPEFMRLRDVQRVFGIPRGSIYNLLSMGVIRGHLLRITGQKSGLRLINVASLRSYIERQGC